MNNKNTWIIVGLVIVVSLSLVGYGMYKNSNKSDTSDEVIDVPTEKPETPPVEEPETPTLPPAEENVTYKDIPEGKSPTNASYVIDGKLITLEDGKYEEEIPNSSAKGAVNVFTTAQGDLNDDNLADTALMLTKTTGGSGTFYYIVAAISQENNNVRGTNAILIGDRIQPQTVEIIYGEIIVNYAVPQVDEDGNKSSLAQTKYFRVEDKNHLVEKESAGD